MVIKLKQEAEHNLSVSACPHDCPSTCALEVTHDDKNIFKVKKISRGNPSKKIIN